MTESSAQAETLSATGFEKKRNRGRTRVFAIAVAAVVATLAVVSLVIVAMNTQSKPSGELNVGLVLEPSNLNVRTTPGAALDQVLLDNVYQGLVTLKSGTLEVIPALATNYQVSEDGRTYTFTVNTKAKFHSGNALTVDDVVTSLNDTKELLGAQVSDIRAEGDDTVIIELDEPFALLLFNLAGRAGIILESAATNDLNSTTNGTGPYTLEEWKQGDSITLTAVEEYWGTPATLERVVFSYIPDPQAAVNATLDGAVDVQTALNPEFAAEFENAKDFELVRSASTDVFTLAYNGAVAPLNDLRVREAISRSIDQEAIIEALLGDGLPLGSPITELELGYTDLTAVNDFDPESAKELLAEAGVSNLELTMTIPNFYGTTVANLLVSQLAEVGITLNIDSVEFATWLERVYTNRDYQLSFIDHAEAYDFGNYANPDYYFNFDNAEVQELYAMAMRTTQAAASNEYLQSAATIVAEQAPAKWLYNYTPTTVIHSGVKGFPTSNTNSRINLAGVTVAE